MRTRERGASLLIPVLLVVTVGAFAVVVAATQSGADIQGTDAQAESTEALFLAETGVERATRRFFAGSACSNLGLSETLANLATIGFTGGRSITITAGVNSVQDFAGTALPATQCRIQVTGRNTTTNVARTVQVIMDRSDNFIGAQPVAGFDNPAGAVNPAASWTGGAYDWAGGNIAGALPNCTRSAYVVKARGGAGTANATSQGSAPVAFTVPRPITLEATFDYRILHPNDGGVAACTTNPNTGPSCIATHPTYQVGSPAASGNGHGQICMTLRDSTGANWLSTRWEVSSVFDASGAYSVAPAPACLPGTQRGFVVACSSFYNPPAARGRVQFTIPAGGSGLLTFDQLTFKLYIPNPGGAPPAYEMWMDNLILRPLGVTPAGIAAWRDCAVSTCPAV